MKRFGKLYRLQADSFEGVSGDFERVALDMARTLRFQGRKLRPGPLLNALVLWFVRLPPEARQAIAADALRSLEALMEAEGGEDAAESAPFEVAHDEGPTPPKRGRKRA